MINLSKRYTAIFKLMLPWVAASILLLALDSRGFSNGLRGGLEKTIWPLNQVTAWAVTQGKAPVDYLNYMKQGLGKIASLEQRLKKASVDYAYLASLEEENKNLTALLNQKPAGENQPKGIAAVVIDTNQTIINKGSLDGLKENQVVVDGSGAVVGRIKLARPHVGVLEKPTDATSRISAKINRKPISGMLVGKGGWMVLDGILQAESIEIGDVVVTNGLDGIYPPNLALGTVTAINSQPADVTKQATVEAMVSTGSAVWVKD